MPPRGQHQSTPNLARFLEMTNKSRGRDASFDAIALDLASDIGDNRPYNEAQLNMQHIAGSVNTHLPGFAGNMKRKDRAQRDNAEDTNMMSRLVLARMNTLEEGFKDILKEVKDWRSAAGSRGTSDAGGASNGLTVAQRRLARKVEKEKDRERAVLHEGGRPQTALREVATPSTSKEDAQPNESSPFTPAYGTQHDENSRGA